MTKQKTQSDNELVLLSLENSKHFAELIERYQPKLSRYIFRLCGCQAEDIEDLLQEVFIKIYRNLNDFDHSLKFSSWAYRITHNEVISHYRKNKSRPISVELIPESVSHGNLTDEFAVKVDAKLNKAKIGEILSAMDLKYREVLILRFFEEKDYAEISDIIKKPMGTVATLVSRAKKQFNSKAIALKIEF